MTVQQSLAIGFHEDVNFMLRANTDFESMRRGQAAALSKIR